MSNNNKNYTLMDAKKAEEIVRSNVKKRRRKDIVLKSIGQFAIFVALSFLVFLFVSIFYYSLIIQNNKRFIGLN